MVHNTLTSPRRWRRRRRRRARRRWTRRRWWRRQPWRRRRPRRPGRRWRAGWLHDARKGATLGPAGVCPMPPQPRPVALRQVVFAKAEQKVGIALRVATQVGRSGWWRHAKRWWPRLRLRRPAEHHMLQRRRRRRCLPRRLRWHGLCCMGRDRLLRALAHGIGVSGRCELVLDEQCQHKQPGCECHGKHRSAPSQEIDAARCTARTPEARMAALGSISLVLLGAEPHVTISPRHGPMLVGAVAGWLPLYLLVRRVPVGDRVAPRRHVSSSGGGVQASTLAGTSCVAPESTPYSRRLGAKLRGSCGISQSREERGCVLRSAAYSSTPRAGVHRCA